QQVPALHSLCVLHLHGRDTHPSRWGMDLSPGWKTNLLRFPPAPSLPAAEHFPVESHWGNLSHPHHRPALHYPPRKSKLQEYFPDLPILNFFGRTVFLRFPAVPSVFPSGHCCPKNCCCILPGQYCITKAWL